MSNAAIFLHPDGYDTTGPRLMGRHSAGESFLRGFLRHADVESHVFYSPSGHSVSQLAALVERIHPTTKPVTWIAKHERPRLAEVGCLYYPQPSLAREAWNRRPYGPETYSICGVTHTTASHLAMDSIAELMTGPTEPWDGLVCTSAAVRKGVETQLVERSRKLRFFSSLRA